MLKPKLIDTLQDYSLSQFRGDLIAGIVVGIVALPLGLAFAIASGVTPEKGLITAIIAGFIISALGGSRVQIGGPTGAFVVIVYSIIQEFGIGGLTIATIMAGLILIMFGLARLGSVIKLIPYPVIIGFTSGIAVIIFSSQINDMLGLGLTNIPAEFFEKWHLYLTSLSHASLPAIALSAATITIILALYKVNRNIPGSFIAIILTTLAAILFKMPVETIGDRFGEIGGASFALEVPKFNLEEVTQLIRPALTIAILAAIESLLSAVVADGMTGGKHRSNMELIAQGVANIVTPLFGGIPATGAIARTATNVHNGGRTPVAGIIHAFVLFCLLFFFGKYASLIPFATLAGILAVISYRMAEWHSFGRLLKSPKSDVAVLISVFLLTVIFDLTVAIEFGIVLAAMLLIKRLVDTEVVSEIQGVYIDEEERHDPDAVSRKVIPAGAEVYEINGPFFFGVVSTFIETMNNLEKGPKVRILRMRHVPSVDATALNALRGVLKQSKLRGVIIILSGVNDKVLKALRNSDITSIIGEENICPNISAALNKAKEYLEA